MKKKPYVIQQAQFLHGVQYQGAGHNAVPLWPEIKRMFGREPKPGDALMYLIRRFGYTVNHSDPHKELCDYYLTTPDPEVFLCISIKASSVRIVPCAERDLFERATYGGDMAEAARIVTACTVALNALRRPTSVRDIEIGLMGQDTEHFYGRYVKPSVSAGLGANFGEARKG